MRRIGLMCAMALASGVAMGQMAGMSAPPAAPAGPVGPAAEVQRGYAGLKVNILKSADIMPADGYAFKPTPEVRMYARILNHITEAQLHSCGAVNGTKDLPKVPADAADKAAVIAGLKASFDECDKAFASTTDANFLEMFTVGPAKRSRAGLLWGTVSHDNEQYSALAMYLRLKNLVPPSSEK